MPGSLPGFRGDMDVDQDSLLSSNKRGPPSPPREARKAQRSTRENNSSSPKSSSSSPGSSSSWPRFHCSCPRIHCSCPWSRSIPRTQKLRLLSCSGPVMAPVFSLTRPVSHALHTSPLGKNIIEGETRSLGNGSALVVALWESVFPQGAHPTGRHLHPRGLASSCPPYREGRCPGAYGKVGPLSEEIKDLEEIRSTLGAPGRQ
ncbi:hypothetical protein GWK47_051277 [Chionoecetes opilio]|uniref:Uncharacterized protein n=1 Tax=Chionoecetes opilio TaxID=41210 RepID=A0A8J5CCM4_CHIOP|nr:hypothetical protein GWK47_051277 [Chionoecetes opilio]